MGKRRADREEAGEVVVVGAQAIVHPGSHPRPHECVAAGVELEDGAAMGGVGAVARVEKADVVDMPGDMREKLADMDSALAILAELPRRPEKIAGGGELDSRLLERQFLAVVGLELRLVVEGVDLRRPPLHEHEDHPLGARRHPVSGVGRREGCGRFASEERLCGKPTKPGATSAEHPPTAHRRATVAGVGVDGEHRRRDPFSADGGVSARTKTRCRRGAPGRPPSRPEALGPPPPRHRPRAPPRGRARPR